MQPIHKNPYICNGNENDLSDCRMTAYVGSACNHNQDESIICSKLIDSKLACLYTANVSNYMQDVQWKISFHVKMLKEICYVYLS